MKWPFQYLQRPLLGNGFEVGLGGWFCKKSWWTSLAVVVVWTISWTPQLDITEFFMIPNMFLVFWTFVEPMFQTLFHFSFFKKIPSIFFCFFKLSQISSVNIQYSRNLLSAMFLFSSRTFHFLTGRWGAKVTQNEKEPVFSASTRFLKSDHTPEFQIFSRIWGD